MPEALKAAVPGQGERAQGVALMLTRRCNMTCAHCSVQSGPKIREEPTDAELMAFVQDAADAGLRGLQLTGGEPMLREKLVLDLLRSARKRGMVCTIASNGFWGRNRASAWRKVAALKRAGLTRLTISYDRYHAEFQGPEPALNIARAAEWFDLPLNINVTRVANDPEIAGLVAPFEKRNRLKMRFYDVQPVGRARELPLAELRGETSGFCNACGTPAVTDDGRMTACNGPSYFLGSDSPLVIGSIHETPIAELIDKHTDDPILETIRRAGPERLLRELEEAGVARELGIRRQHAGLCDLCIDINSKPAAVAVLRERLAQPRHAAELAARRMVICKGDLSVEYVNGIGAARLWLDAASGRTERWDEAAEKILGRADFDWTRSADYLARCGMARALAPMLTRPALRRWAPTFFIQHLRDAALSEGLRDLAQREVIRRVADALAEMNQTGILLKGAALIALDAFGDGSRGSLPRRSAGDIDVLVSRPSARTLRERLLDVGFRGTRDAERTGPHHLAPLSLNGVAVEIHTSIMPSFWGLPESEMLRRARPVAQLPPLSTLDPEGMILHAMVHSTAHLFSHGLRAAWDTAWILERFRELDAGRLGEWVASCAMPRSFWVPARVFNGLVALPHEVMKRAPADQRQRRVQAVAEARVFSAVDGAFDLNPISKNGFFLMLHDSYYGRARHITSMFGRDERESRRSAAASARKRDPRGGRSALSVQLREGLMQWRQYQRAIARSPNQAG